MRLLSLKFVEILLRCEPSALLSKEVWTSPISVVMPSMVCCWEVYLSESSVMELPSGVTASVISDCQTFDSILPWTSLNSVCRVCVASALSPICLVMVL